MGGGKAKINKGLSSTDSDDWNYPGIEHIAKESNKAREAKEAGKKLWEDLEFANSVNRRFNVNNNYRPVLSYGRYKGQYILKLPVDFSDLYYNNAPKYDSKPDPRTLAVYVIRDESGVLPDGSIIASERGIPKYTVVYADGSRQSSPHFMGPGPSANDKIWEYLFNMALPSNYASRTYDGGSLPEVTVVRPPMKPINGGLDEAPW